MALTSCSGCAHGVGGGRVRRRGRPCGRRRSASWKSLPLSCAASPGGGRGSWGRKRWRWEGGAGRAGGVGGRRFFFYALLVFIFIGARGKGVGTRGGACGGVGTMGGRARRGWCGARPCRRWRSRRPERAPPSPPLFFFFFFFVSCPRPAMLLPLSPHPCLTIVVPPRSAPTLRGGWSCGVGSALASGGAAASQCRAGLPPPPSSPPPRLSAQAPRRRAATVSAVAAAWCRRHTLTRSSVLRRLPSFACILVCMPLIYRT